MSRLKCLLRGGNHLPLPPSLQIRQGVRLPPTTIYVAMRCVHCGRPVLAQWSVEDAAQSQETMGIMGRIKAIVQAKAASVVNATIGCCAACWHIMVYKKVLGKESTEDLGHIGRIDTDGKGAGNRQERRALQRFGKGKA